MQNRQEIRAIILSAGRGSRLKPLTDHKPKCLVNINKISLLERQIKILAHNGVKEITVVIGYLAENVRKKFRNYREANIKFITNKDYIKTNNMYSLMLAQKENQNGFILMNGDVLFDSKIIKALIESDHGNVFPVDQNNYYQEAMKIIVKDGLIKSISKDIPASESSGCSVDIYKFSKQGSKKLFEKINDIIKNQKRVNQWTEMAIQEIFSKINVYPVYIGGNKWMDIDDFDDLKKAKKIFK